MLDWLRRRICRCPEPEPLIENTGFTGGVLIGFAQSHDFGEAVSYQSTGTITPADPPARPRHLHAVPDETE